MKTCPLLLFVCCIAGCRDTPVSPVAEVRTGIVVRVLIAEGFADGESATVDARGLRVGPYHDFSSFDSLRIDVLAQSPATSTDVDTLLIKIGPMLYRRLQVAPGSRRNLSVVVTQPELAKPHFSALVFFATRPEGRLLLSDFRLVGWRRN